jgi:hypothetical protein
MRLNSGLLAVQQTGALTHQVSWLPVFLILQSFRRDLVFDFASNSIMSGLATTIFSHAILAMLGNQRF